MATVSSKTILGVSYVEWSPVIAGTIIACAVSFVLLQFGNALGFSMQSPYYEALTPVKVLVIGLWILWVQLMASLAGGYAAGRMRTPWETGHENDIRDGAHGLLVWASSSLVAAVAAAVGAFLSSYATMHGVDTMPKSVITPQQAHRYAVIFGFSLTATSIVSAVAAWAMGTIGGDHRDRSAGASLRISFRRIG